LHSPDATVGLRSGCGIGDGGGSRNAAADLSGGWRWWPACSPSAWYLVPADHWHQALARSGLTVAA